MEKVYIFDTTLRDGEQAPGFSMTQDEKIKMALALEKLGVDIIEAGFPITSEGDFEAVREVSQKLEKPVICALARCEEQDIEKAAEALAPAKRKRIHVFIATSEIHMKYKLRLSEEEVVEKAIKAVKLAKKYADEVEFSAEDATRSDPDFLIKVFKEVVKAGADVINVPDTVGYTLPFEFYELIKKIKEAISEVGNPIISVHCHNDLGLATANTLAGILGGARQCEVALNGIGERAGNTSLEEVVMAIKTRKDFFSKFYTTINTKEIYPASRLLSKITGVQVPPNKAIVGQNAFAHEAGIHQDGVLKNPLTYEIMRPEDVGFPSSQIVIGKHSGRHALAKKLAEMGYELSPEEIKAVYKRVKELADKKKRIYDEDIEAIVFEEILKTQKEDRYELISVNFAGGTELTPTATVVIKDGDKIRKASAAGDGPVDAVYKAIQSCLALSPELVDYSVKSISGGTDAQGEVSVVLKIGNVSANGVGISTDIVVASAKAFISAINRIEKVSRIKRNLSLSETRAL
jgi:2-isopropylmalate synthase